METNNNNQKRPRPNIDEALRQFGASAEFAPNFANRVQGRLNEYISELAYKEIPISPLDAILLEIPKLFPRFAIAGMAAVAVLAWYGFSFESELSADNAEWTLEAASTTLWDIQE